MTPWMFGCHIQYTPKPQPRLLNTQRNTNSYRLQNTQRGSRLPPQKCNPTGRDKKDMFTVSCENDCIEVHCVKFCTTVIPSVFVNGISQIEVGPELECQLELCFFFLFLFSKRLFKLLIFFFCTSFIAICLMDTFSVGMLTTRKLLTDIRCCTFCLTFRTRVDVA